MPPDLTPEAIRGASFRTAIRGADTSEVQSFLSEVAGLVERIESERERLAKRLGEFADKDLKSEFEAVGREVAGVLEAAREAAESIRERASADATRWRSESMAEAEQLRKDAKNDAEALRRDAWTTGSDLLNQTVAEARRLREAAERDAITITGEAEREAHRLVSSARREAEDLMRSATMDSEKITADAEKARDDMIERARREAEASQERTRALEQRREELMEELEGVRAALRQMEGTLEAKREDLNLSKSSDTSVRVIPSVRPSEPAADMPTTWEPGETVRVIRGDDLEPEPTPDLPEPVPMDTVEAEALEPNEVAEAASDPAPAVEKAPAEAEAPASKSDDEPVASRSDDIDALFDSLRHPDESGKVSERTEGSAKTEEPEEPKTAEAALPKEPEMRSADDLIELRDAALLPVTNRALRGIKRAVTEAQNIALDGLRTDTAWQPDRVSISETLRADLITLWAESYAAGHDRAEEMTASKLKRPATPTTDSPETLGAAIVADLEREMATVGEGQRERQSAASKVFRAWRTDEAERKVRSLALSGYHRGLVESSPGLDHVWIASGTPCSACRSAASDPPANPPPVHPGCECTVVIRVP
ncbi:MAG: hypothetical protein DWQ40_00595 [Actinobacteria bacterium]|nr:MAG: hypothetical protein DWQ40_00595 [Actinomycetota bacterium]REK33150.1 MAG: hypothetical protein DWQ20_07795 [Actinomycetota bacterium]